MNDYYNEFDPYAAQTLRNLIAAGHIPPGDVDERSILEVRADDLRGYNQCHFFAGIGGWPLALRLAGWPRDRPLWTGSPPCQPYSAASVANGGAKGQSDERDLWPAFGALICERRPSKVLGEQVASSVGWGWWDRAALELERAGYACAAAVLRADAYGAAHERRRLYWVAHAGGAGWEGLESIKFVPGGAQTSQPQHGDPLARARRALEGDFSDLLLGDGFPVGVGRSRIHGYGNAIVPQVAASFIRAAL